MSKIADQLRDRIRSGGAIPFAEFMDEALYGEDAYYTRAQPPIGGEGDYVTASSYSPLFAQCTVRLLQRADLLLGRNADYFEVGYGGGEHLIETAAAATPETDARRTLGCDRSPRPLPEAIRQVSNVDEIDPRAIRGLIFSYELFDALPVHRLIGRQDGSVGELWVGLSTEDTFEWQEGPMSKPELSDLLGNGTGGLGHGQIADLSPAWRPLYRQLAERLDRGLLVTCDYGFDRQRLLDYRVRAHGTLACYRRHRVHRDPFADPGRQDITAHVDFTTLIEEGEAAGLTTLAFTRQARWLGANGIFENLENASQATRLEAIRLLDPAGMGEEIRVLVQCRDFDPADILDLELLGGS